MDQTLHPRVKLDIALDVVRIDIRGSLTQDSRPSLMQIIQRVRRMGITSRIHVHLGRAAFVESSALAGLRNDLNAVGGGVPAGTSGGLPIGAGVSLELNPHDDGPAAELEPLELPTDLAASLDTSGTGPLTSYSDDELLAASDSVFGLLDNPADMARSELLASYEEIGLEISRRQVGRQPEPA